MGAFGSNYEVSNTKQKPMDTNVTKPPPQASGFNGNKKADDDGGIPTIPVKRNTGANRLQPPPPKVEPKKEEKKEEEGYSDEFDDYEEEIIEDKVESFDKGESKVEPFKPEKELSPIKKRDTIEKVAVPQTIKTNAIPEPEEKKEYKSPSPDPMDEEVNDIQNKSESGNEEPSGTMLTEVNETRDE